MGGSQQGDADVCLLMDREQGNKQSFFGQLNLWQMLGPRSVKDFCPTQLHLIAQRQIRRKQDSPCQSKQGWLVCFFLHF